MSEDGFIIESTDKIRIFIYRWLPSMSKPIKCVIQISHGMAEHAERYRNFAKYLNSHGIGVYANDHRGHGKTAGNLRNVGYFADKSGWDLVVRDMFQLTERIKKTHPEVPILILGHSMGSFLLRDYISRNECSIDGAILSGTAGDPGIMGYMGIIIAKVSCLLKGNKTPNKLLDKLSFGSFNNYFKPARTKFDWLSRDEDIVDKYIKDEYCGSIFSSGFFLDLFKGIRKVNTKKCINNINKDLPVLFFSGDKDPVGDFSKGVLKTLKLFKKNGIKNVDHKLYKNGRHEMLNEINKDQVYLDVYNWIISKLNNRTDGFSS